MKDIVEMEGLYARTITLQDINWTESAKQAELIKRTVQENYGFFGKEFAESLQEFGLEELYSVFEESRTTVHKLMKKRDSLTDRIEVNIAVILTTLRLMRAFFDDPKINVAESIAILINADQTQMMERNIPLKAKELVRDEVKKHKLVKIDERTDGDKAWGYSGEDDVWADCSMEKSSVVYLPETTVTQILKKNNIASSYAVYRQWKTDGTIVKADKDRYTEHSHGPRLMELYLEEEDETDDTSYADIQKDSKKLINPLVFHSLDFAPVEEQQDEAAQTKVVTFPVVETEIASLSHYLRSSLAVKIQPSEEKEKKAKKKNSEIQKQLEQITDPKDRELLEFFYSNEPVEIPDKDSKPTSNDSSGLDNDGLDW